MRTALFGRPASGADRKSGAILLGASLLAGAVLLLASALAGAEKPAPDPLGELTGGATTVYADGRNAFSLPAANLTDEERTRFVIGNSFFKRNWVEAPASTRARDGLGPHFIARSCGGCHVQDGRGAPPDLRRRLSGATNPAVDSLGGPAAASKARAPAADAERALAAASDPAGALPGDDHEQPVALLMRLSVPGRGAQGGPKPEPVYGEALSNAAVGGVQPEGRVTLRYTDVPGRFADGTPYVLQRPHYGIEDLAYGPLAAGTLLGPRIAPQLVGVGLLEAIADEDIERNAREQAAASGPVKGRVNRVWDAFAERERIGRYGWKANVASLAHQTAAAFQGDIGITSRRFPHESCSAAQADCLDAPGGARAKAHAGSAASASLDEQTFEIDDRTLGDVVFYQAALAPPARRDVNDPQVLQGRRLFEKAQCAACHRPSYVTATPPFPRLSSPALEGQRIWPYTDLLLHDMGEDLADGRPDFAASGRQWRTPPLWGIGLIEGVNGHDRLLHDGRARGVLEAILWHGGEAEGSRNHVLKMSRAEREALVRFVESL